MNAPARANDKVFRPAAPRLFIFLAGVGYPGYIAAILVVHGYRLDWSAFLLGAAALVPTALLLAGAVSMMMPTRLTPKGVHAQTLWGTASFVRWEDIRQVRPFTFLNLRWLRLYSSDDGSVTWLAVFQSPPAEFRQELERLAPAAVLEQCGLRD